MTHGPCDDSTPRDDQIHGGREHLPDKEFQHHDERGAFERILAEDGRTVQRGLD